SRANEPPLAPPPCFGPRSKNSAPTVPAAIKTNTTTTASALLRFGGAAGLATEGGGVAVRAAFHGSISVFVPGSGRLAGDGVRSRSVARLSRGSDVPKAVEPPPSDPSRPVRASPGLPVGIAGV